jgi:hypothetical protein
VAVLAGFGAERIVLGRGSAWRMALVGFASAAVAAVALAAVGPALARLGAPAAADLSAHLGAGLPHAVLALAALGAVAVAAARGHARAAAMGLVLLAWVESVAASGFALRPGAPEARLGLRGPGLAAATPGPRLIVRAQIPPRPHVTGWDDLDERTFTFGAGGGTDFNVGEGLDSLDFYGGFSPRRYAAVVEALGQDWPRAARRYALTHVVAPSDLADSERALAGATRLPELPGTRTTPFAVPHRAWASFPPRTDVAPSADAAVERVTELYAAGDRAAVVEAEAPLPAAEGRVLTAAREPEHVLVEAEADGDAVLVVNDAFWPGWKAALDGRPIPILAADGFVRAVAWPRGRHRLEMTYDPPELAVGLALSAAAAVVVALACLWLARHAVSGAARRPGAPAPP